MPEIITAKSAGFCFGVQRAVDTVYEEIARGGAIYTYGPIIHNEEVVRDLEEKGVRVIESPQEIDALESGTVIVRSHGVPEKLMNRIESSRAHCVDATCPFVKRIHNTVAAQSAKGDKIVIIGNAGHPEVEGIMGWSLTPATVIETREEAAAFNEKTQRTLCVVAQTTFNQNKFQELVDILKQKGYNITVVNTICNATRERQEEAKRIAAVADVMIVIGGKHSSNSAKLYEICRRECERTFFIQTRDDLHLSLTGEEKVIGITAGASTPKNIIEEVQAYVRTDI
ncbi:MAG: 4-hydroxy-3-methylbut-2-enyl diphosphate reductase [Eubacteriales bacterium]|nr:4-hydroxy-3-methylbut-2-enyl diphosphate reductase [Eubacteriales bacterium]